MNAFRFIIFPATKYVRSLRGVLTELLSCSFFRDQSRQVFGSFDIVNIYVTIGRLFIKLFFFIISSRECILAVNLLSCKVLGPSVKSRFIRLRGRQTETKYQSITRFSSYIILSNAFYKTIVNGCSAT